jgi:type III secretion system YscQ/HrcQ family protein
MGTATLTFIGFDSDPEASGSVELPVSFGVAHGRVSIESGFAIRVVDAMLGGNVVVSTARAAGPAERGVLAGVLAPLFDRVGGSVGVGPLPVRQPETVALAFRLETVLASGWIRLTLPTGGLPAVGAAADIWRARAGRVPVTGHVEIAATSVPARALAGLKVGDAVVFDGMAAAPFIAGAPRDARLRVGHHAADVTVDAGGNLSMIGGFVPRAQQEGPMSASESSTDAATVLAAASIEVVAEIGRIALRGDELLGLAPGAVLAMGKDHPRVTLRVGGEIWADGEIVDIDGELGVRVTRLANR